ncbi:ATP-binding protein, partial [Bifidobacterium aesculapii]|uniref:ATP-binding protein n=1 Tax=Bifidobacterium aesculapii TaxID=1329411 RepID=UPI00128EBA20
DFSKHAPIRLLERLRLTWNSIPAQLARENRKFMYGLIRTGARAREFEECLQWLRDYGIITKVPRLSAIRKPLSGYAQLDTFKVYLVDTGLLGALSDLDSSVIAHEDRMFTEFKGSLTEQYVCQQLVGHGLDPFYWANPSARGTAEVDFVTTVGSQVTPIEVKAKTNLRAKSLHVAVEKYGIPKSVRTSLAGYRDEGWVINVPLWAIGALPSLM